MKVMKNRTSFIIAVLASLIGLEIVVSKLFVCITLCRYLRLFEQI